MEDGNIKEHRDYLSTEEEKRKKARLVRTAVQGPLIRWISKVEEETVREEPPPPPTPSYTYTAVPYHQYYPPPPPPPPPSQATSTPGAKSKSSTSRSFLHVSAAYHAELPQQNPSSPSASQTYPTPTSTVQVAGSSNAPTSESQAPPSTLSWHSGYSGASQVAPASTLQSYTQPYYSNPYYYYPHYAQPQPQPAPPEPIERIERVTKNYVIHELSQQEKQRPPWHSTMSAMFGDHVKWEELRVYTSKGRPLCKHVFSLQCSATLTQTTSPSCASLSYHRESCELQGPSYQRAIRGYRGI